MDDIQQEIEKIRKLIQSHPRRDLLYDLDTMLSMAVEEAKRLKARKVL